MISDGTETFPYDAANRLIEMVSVDPDLGATLAYHTLGRLHCVTNGSGTERFLDLLRESRSRFVVLPRPLTSNTNTMPPVVARS